MQLLLNAIVFNARFPKGEKEKNRRGSRKEHRPLNPLEVTSANEEGLATMGGYNNGYPPLCLHLHYEKQQSRIRTPCKLI